MKARSNKQSVEPPVFLDEVTIVVEAGRGGDGMVHFRREKFRPRGGPDGGDGGRGGSVYLEATSSLSSLLEFEHTKHFKAGNASPGGTNGRTGARGKDLTLYVPEGTQVFDAETGELLADLRVAGSTLLVARGGRGGRGNAAFADPVHQAPRLAERGEPGEVRTCRLELKLLADVGLVGLPNAGKSTLVSRLSRARPKVADYPFTTLVPHLGVVKGQETEFTLADLPGLIEGASKGAGLGHDFLRHLERCGVLVHVVDCSDKTPEEALEALKLMQNELVAFNPDLAERPQVVALNKFDLWGFEAEAEQEYTAAFEETGLPVHCISGATGWHLPELQRELEHLVIQERKAHPLPEAPEAFEVPRTEAPLEVKRAGPGVFKVSGGGLERFLHRIDFSSRESLYYLHRRLQRLGVLDELRRLGAGEGDTVKVGDFEFEFTDFPTFE